MAGKDHSYELIEQWFDLSNTPKVKSVTVGEVSSVVFVRPVKINVTVIVPAKFISGKPPKFDLGTCAPVRRLWETMSQMHIETLEAVTLARREAAKDPKAAKQAKEKLDKLNGFFKKSLKQFRPLLRDAVARAVGNGAKAQDLQSLGSVDFKEYEFKPGVFGAQSSEDAKGDLPDLSPAFKIRKWQQCGLIWKGKDAVLVVRRRKEFKATELKELRKHLPKNQSGASTLACQFLAESGSTVKLGLDPEEAPKEQTVAHAIKHQCGRTVKVSFGPPPDDMEEEDGEEEEEKSKGKSKAKGKTQAKEKTEKKSDKKSKK